MQSFDSLESLATTRGTETPINFAECACGERYDNRDGNLHCWRCNPPE